ncbi:MAG TPA: ATP-binding protein [Burkholderiaceae bacterium]|nr:ATP-binding protein [Burkholderiaceae bacterium]
MDQTSSPARPFDLALFAGLQALTVACWLVLGLAWSVPALIVLAAGGAAMVSMRGLARLRRIAPMALALVWGVGIALHLPGDGSIRMALMALGLAQAMILARGIASAGMAALVGGAVLLPIAAAITMQGDPAWAAGLLLLGAIHLAMRVPLRSGPAEDSTVLPPARALALPEPVGDARRSDDRFQQLEREASLAREQAEHALAAAHQAVREKTRFLAAASHDLRQPVHAIGLFVGALKEEIREGRGRYLVDRLERSMAGLDELFNRLLDISRLDAGTIEPKMSVFAIVPLLQTLETRFAHMAENRRLDFRVHVPRPCSVRSDPALLVEILMNLLSNAFRYTERGGILMGTRRRGDRLLIQVWDTGIGIPPEHIDKIFGEFVQLGNSSRDRRHGLGLGLAIVRRLSDGLGCPVRVRSRPRRGSLFEISVPLSAEPAPLERIADPDFDPALLQGMLVLVVDDELDILIGMEALLVSWGCFVILARSVGEARRHLDQAERFPDLLITDHRLGDNTGSADVVAIVSELVPVPVPVIVVSGDATAPLQALADRQGWSLLPKPVNPARLRSLVVELTVQP